MPNNYWAGKSALITGASGGIGENAARFLAKKGLHVILVARSLDKLQNIAAQITAEGGKASFYQADLSQSAARISLAEQVIADHGAPDVLINNAGIGWYGFFHEMPWSVAHSIIELNIMSTTHLTSLFLPRMSKLPKARIINIGSISGKLPEQGIALYSASKAYLDAFTTCLYRELRGTNVTASVLRAGPVKTDFYSRAIDLPSGGRVPGEVFAVKAQRISSGIWSLINHPMRFSYVPFYLLLSPLLETFFAWAIDLVGPILLKNTKKTPA
jgi:short-subunit dehydrogenase